eukprot:g37962.t1
MFGFQDVCLSSLLYRGFEDIFEQGCIEERRWLQMEASNIISKIEAFCKGQNISTDRILVITIQRNRTTDVCSLIIDFKRKDLLPNYPLELYEPCHEMKVADFKISYASNLMPSTRLPYQFETDVAAGYNENRVRPSPLQHINTFVLRDFFQAVSMVQPKDSKMHTPSMKTNSFSEKLVSSNEAGLKLPSLRTKTDWQGERGLENGRDAQKEKIGGSFDCLHMQSENAGDDSCRSCGRCRLLSVLSRGFTGESQNSAATWYQPGW